jgi:hypothetical protein
MNIVGGWKWRKIWFDPGPVKKADYIINCEELILANEGIVWDEVRNSDVILITGDGKTLPDDVREFESWKIPHDLYCVNRSMLYFERQVDHWAAIDVEESAWFTQNVMEKHMPRKRILRHTIGVLPDGYDIFWDRKVQFTDDKQRRLFVGNTGYFALLTAFHMGYKKVVLAGMPLDTNPHWYDPEGAEGPTWYPHTYTQWMDFKMKHPKADMVRSMSAYSAFILGHATKEWLVEGNGNH